MSRNWQAAAAMLIVLTMGSVRADAVRADTRPICVVHDRFDLIERNHFYDGDGKLVFTQWMFMDWQPDGQAKWGFRCGGGFRIDKGEFHLRRAQDGEGWILRWCERNIVREVYADQFREYHSQYDRELVDRRRLKMCQRRGLTDVDPNPHTTRAPCEDDSPDPPAEDQVEVTR